MATSRSHGAPSAECCVRSPEAMEASAVEGSAGTDWFPEAPVVDIEIGRATMST